MKNNGYLVTCYERQWNKNKAENGVAMHQVVAGHSGFLELV